MNVLKNCIAIAITFSCLLLVSPAMAGVETITAATTQAQGIATVAEKDSAVQRANEAYLQAKNNVEQAEAALLVPAAKSVGESDAAFAERVKVNRAAEAKQLRFYQSELRRQERRLDFARAIQSGEYWDPSIN